jgi:hypothetical protein
MIDVEKVIKGLERCLVCDMSVVASPEGEKAYRDCEYTVGLYCKQKNLMRDAIKLIKEQQKLIDEITQRRINNGEFD